MAKGNGGTRASGSAKATAPTPEEIFERRIANAINEFKLRSPNDDSLNMVGNIDNGGAFWKRHAQERTAIIDAMGKMYDTYDIPVLDEVQFAEKRNPGTAAETKFSGPYDRTMMFYQAGAKTKLLAEQSSIHEMTHLMVGHSFGRMPKEINRRVSELYQNAVSSIPRTNRNVDENYWRENKKEFLSETFAKALTGQSLNRFEKEAFLIVHNHFKKKS